MGQNNSWNLARLCGLGVEDEGTGKWCSLHFSPIALVGAEHTWMLSDPDPGREGKAVSMPFSINWHN